MRKFPLQKAFLIVLLSLFCLSIQGQNKTKITIKKSENGQTETLKKDFEGSNEELQNFLKDMGIDIDVKDKKDVVEIIIDQKNFDAEKLAKWGENFLEKMEAKRPKQAFLGIQMINVDEGIEITKVIPDSPAEKIGLLPGDIVLAIDGQEVNSTSALIDVVEKHESGDVVKLKVNRAGKQKIFKAELAEKDQSFSRIIHGFDALHFDEENKESEGEIYLFDWDKLGGLNFNFDCEKNSFDIEELEKKLEQLGEELPERLKSIEGLNSLENFDFDIDVENPFTESMTVIVLVEDLTQEECDKVNENAEHRISINNNLALENVRFFPNPNDGVFNLNFETPKNGDLTVNIYNQNGKTVYKEMLAEFEGEYTNRIDISERANGTYYLQIIQNNQTFNKKIIKQ